MRRLLCVGTALPVLGAGMFALAVRLSPGHDLLFDPPSLLGTARMPHPVLFNLGLLLLAAACLPLGPALARGLARGGADPALSGLVGLCVALVAAYFAFAGLFPMPHPLHRGLGLNVAGLALPVLGMFALRSAGRWRGRQWLLGAIFVGTTGMWWMGLGPDGAPGRAMLGLLVALSALAFLVSVAVLCDAALRADGREAGGAAGAAGRMAEGPPVRRRPRGHPRGAVPGVALAIPPPLRDGALVHLRRLSRLVRAARAGHRAPGWRAGSR